MCEMGYSSGHTSLLQSHYRCFCLSVCIRSCWLEKKQILLEARIGENKLKPYGKELAGQKWLPGKKQWEHVKVIPGKEREGRAEDPQLATVSMTNPPNFLLAITSSILTSSYLFQRPRFHFSPSYNAFFSTQHFHKSFYDL